jgi:hypothetical protein
MSPQPDERVDELRRQLRALGYLDAGVDRFVLAPARGRRGPAALAARFALRVGSLGAILLGPAGAIGVGARLPGLISGVRDAAVIAVYLAVVFWVAVTAVSFLVMLGTIAIARVRGGRFDRRGPRAARIAAWVMALATLVYLTLWWRTASAGFGWSAPLWTASALVLAVAISLLLGHAQRIATLAVLVSAAGPSAHLPPVGARSWRVILGGGALAFAGAAVLLVVTARADPAPIDRPPLTVAGGRRVRLIAIDGFDPASYHSAARRPEGPSRGLWDSAVRLAPHDTSDPARAWTTMATGEPPEIHGVQRLETRRLAGIQGILAGGDGAFWQSIRAATDVARLTRPAVASRDERRSKTIWEVAEDAGLRTAVVNWWATWPAPPGPGIVITDRAVLRLEHGGSLDAEIAPADLYPALQAQWPQIRASARETTAAAFAGISEARTLAVLRRSAELDATIIGITRALPEPARDLDVVYLPGLDVAQHTLLGPADGGAPSPSVVAARVEGLKEYYRFLAGLLGPLLKPARDQIVMVVTSPGRVQSPAGGIFGVRYPDAAIETKDATADVVDIAPTVLAALGIPLSRELAGAPVTQLLPEPGAGAQPRRYVATYGRPFTVPAARQGTPLDQETIDRLRSLGYIK